MLSPALIFLLILYEEPDPVHFLNRHRKGKRDPICLNSKQISSLSYFTYSCTGTGIGAESHTAISIASPPFKYLRCPLNSTNLTKKVKHLAIYSYLEGFPETRLHVSVTQTQQCKHRKKERGQRHEKTQSTPTHMDWEENGWKLYKSPGIPPGAQHSEAALLSDCYAVEPCHPNTRSIVRN